MLVEDESPVRQLAKPKYTQIPSQTRWILACKSRVFRFLDVNWDALSVLWQTVLLFVPSPDVFVGFTFLLFPINANFSPGHHLSELALQMLSTWMILIANLSCPNPAWKKSFSQNFSSEVKSMVIRTRLVRHVQSNQLLPVVFLNSTTTGAELSYILSVTSTGLMASRSSV